MKNLSTRTLFAAASAALLLVSLPRFILPAEALSLTIRNDLPGNASSSILYGLMYEDINRCGDGGLYGQMLRNWNFQSDDTGTKAPTLEYWSTVGSAKITLDSTTGLNAVNTNSLRLDVPSTVSFSSRAGVANEGWWGLRVQSGETYTASFFAKSSAYTGSLTVSLESTDGTVLASAKTKLISKDGFSKYTVTLKPKVRSTSITNRFVISVNDPKAAGSSIYLQVLSLFGETFKGRANGLRQDIGQSLHDLSPSFFRFPGGNNLEGQSIPQRWKWNETIGPLEDRKGRFGDWGYWNTNGQGLLDYVYMCEDLNMEPILDVYAGYSLDGSSVPEADLGPYIQEVLDELEYLTGSTSTTLGALRASHGHPDPVNIKYIEIGNEDWFSTTYEYRYRAFYDAIKAAYPDVTIIATATQSSRPYNILDDHYYLNTSAMIDHFNFYDNHARDGHNIFVGEYGTNTKGCCGASPANLEAAIGDAVFITGLEKNSDLVSMIAYAPGMKRYGHEQWNPDMIHFDTESVWLTPTYHVFKEWSAHRPDTILQVDQADGGYGPLYWVVGSNKAAKSVYIKMVNTGGDAETVSFGLKSLRVKKNAVARIITGSSVTDENTKSSTTVNTVESTFTISGSTFNYTFAPYSATVLQLHTQ